MIETKERDSELKLEDVTITFPEGAANRTYQELKKVLGGEKLTPSNVTIILVSMMQVVEGYTDLKGPQKKAVILDAINHLIDDQVQDPNDKNVLQILVRATLPTVIDTLVSIDRRELSIKVKKVFNCILKCCYSMCKSGPKK